MKTDMIVTPTKPSILSRPTYLTKFTLYYLLAYIGAIFFCKSYFYADPTSRFFDDSVAYTQDYSAQRQLEAAEFIQEAGHQEQFKVNNNSIPELCVGISSIARDGSSRYFRETVGSLLHGLDESERSRIHVMLFLAHTNPVKHPAYFAKWLPNVADTILDYNLQPYQLGHLIDLENQGGQFREKGLYDYAHVLRACNKTGAPYIAMFEDDTIAVDGWFHRTMNAIEEAQRQVMLKGKKDFFYLRLFYTEEYFGWNSEEWPSYLWYSILVASTELLIFYTFRRAFPTSDITKTALSYKMMILYIFAYTPAAIVLFFFAGRMSVFPHEVGVKEMPKYGCCSQALVFPNTKVTEIVNFFDYRRVGFVDQLLEIYADENDEVKYAVTPTVVQHVGLKSSKQSEEEPIIRHNRSASQVIFNFGFEHQDWQALREEHAFVLGKEPPPPVTEEAYPTGLHKGRFRR